MSAERWRDVKGAEGYEVSDLGRVRSWLKSGRGRARGMRSRPLLRALVPAAKRGGYLTLTFRIERRTVLRYVHHLVLEAFVGERPDGTECRHRDNDVTNNRLSNLSWATHAENERDKLANGTRLFGARNPDASLTQKQAEDIRARREAGESGGALAREFGVSQATISRVFRGRRYATAS